MTSSGPLSTDNLRPYFRAVDGTFDVLFICDPCLPVSTSLRLGADKLDQSGPAEAVSFTRPLRSSFVEWPWKEAAFGTASQRVSYQGLQC